jgi:tetratricopeptide (TPR) repeat protein
MRWSLLAVTLAACAHTHVMPPVPTKGGPVWRELTSEHFVLWTDLSSERAARALRHLEDFRDIMVSYVFNGAAKLPAKSLVIALRSYDDWALFGNRDIIGFFRPIEESPVNTPFLAYEAEAHSESGYSRQGVYEYYWEKSSDPTTIVQHELGHLVMHTLVDDPPAWLDEGIASYFQTARIDDKAGKAEIGRLPKDLAGQIRANPMRTLDSVLRLEEGSDRHAPGFYLRSQVLVFYLLNREPEQFATYQRVLKQLPPGSGMRVWEQVFADRTTWDMQNQIDRWLAAGTLTVMQFRLGQHGTGAPRETRRLSDADVYTIRALLFIALGGKGKVDEALANVQAAVAAEPTHLLGNLMQAVILRRADRERARAVLAANPNDWRAWFLIGLAAEGDAGEQKEAVRHICDILAADPTQHAPGQNLCDANAK